MFVPPPSKESLLIVRRSASRPVSRSFLAVAMTVVCAGVVLLYSTSNDGGHQPAASALFVEQVDATSFEVFQFSGIDATAKDIRVLMKILDGREEQIERENDAVLKSRRPSGAPKNDLSFARAESQVVAAPTPTLNLPVAPKKIPSSGEWLNGDVRLGDSGLARIDTNVAVFVRGKQRVDFRVGAVLPNGEVVLQVDPASLSVRTDRRFIRIIDDGS